MNTKHFSYLAMAFVLSFCSFSYQTLIAFAVQSAVGGGLMPWLLVLGAFLFGIGLGTWRVGKTALLNSASALMRIEYLIVLLGMFSLFVLFTVDGFAKMSFLGYATIQSSFALISICTTAGVVWALIIGYYTGFELPYILDLYAKENGKHENLIIAAHYFGNLASAIIVQLWFIPKMDVLASSLVVAAFNLVIFIYLLVKNRAVVPYVKNAIYALIIAIMMFGLQTVSKSFYQTYLKVNYFRPHINTYNWQSIKNLYYVIQKSAMIHRMRSHHQYIDIVHLPSIKNEKVIDTLLYLDTHLQFGSSDEKIYHELMTHVPVSYFQKKPRRALIIGGGDGLLARELLRYGDVIQKIDLVELDPEMIQLGKYRPQFKKLNEASLHSPKVHVYIDDAFSVLKQKGEQYDFILIDLPYPHNPDLAKLHSVEFYKLIKRRLEPDGFVVLDFPLKLSNFEKGDRNDILFNSLKLAGFQHFLPFYGYDTFVTASLIEPETKGELKSDFISPVVFKELTNQSQILSGIIWNKNTANSIFKPKSYGRDF